MINFRKIFPILYLLWRVKELTAGERVVPIPPSRCNDQLEQIVMFDQLEKIIMFDKLEDIVMLTKISSREFYINVREFCLKSRPIEMTNHKANYLL